MWGKRLVVLSSAMHVHWYPTYMAPWHVSTVCFILCWRCVGIVVLLLGIIRLRFKVFVKHVWLSYPLTCNDRCLGVLRCQTHDRLCQCSVTGCVSALWQSQVSVLCDRLCQCSVMGCVSALWQAVSVLYDRLCQFFVTGCVSSLWQAVSVQGVVFGNKKTT